MAERTAISWTHHTFNPWWGCTKVSPACDHCYAERDAQRHYPRHVLWGANAERRAFGDAHWALPERWDRAAAKAGERRRVFCASMADVFDNQGPHLDRERLRLFGLIARTPHLDWLLLTKRIGNAWSMIADAVKVMRGQGLVPEADTPWPWPNVWLGATVVTQAEADRDIPKLLSTPARVRFVSIEPMLGPIDLDRLDAGESTRDALRGHTEHREFNERIGCDRLDWVIAGGESGPKARPAHPDWFRSLRDQCAAAGVPFHFKQWGEWTPGENVERQRGTVDTAFLCDDGWHVYPLNLATDEGHIDDQPDLYRIGKAAAGRLLDGLEHNGFPAVAA